MLDPNNEPDRIYLEVESWELGKCAMCQKEISLAGVILIHIALCSECSEMIRSYDSELSH